VTRRQKAAIVETEETATAGQCLHKHVPAEMDTRTAGCTVSMLSPALRKVGN
jgi:hypothetical protein